MMVENTMKIIDKDLKLFCTWIFNMIVRRSFSSVSSL